MSDLKESTIVNGVPQNYEPDILTTNSYYSFGMLQPNKHFGTEDYDYGFNGKRMDNEVSGSGNSYDFEARMYNPRIGRWLSRDRYEAKYSSFSPYNYTLNSPISFIDPTGNVVEWANDPKSQALKAEVEKMSAKSVLFRTVYNQLQDAPIVIKASVNEEKIISVAKQLGFPDPSEVGAYFTQSTNEVVFKESSGTKALAEEFFHAYQINLIYSDVNVANIESEAKVFDAAVYGEINGFEESVQLDDGSKMSFSTMEYAGQEANLIYLEESLKNQTPIESNEDLANYKLYTKGFEDFYKDTNHPYSGNVTQTFPKAYNKVVNDSKFDTSKWLGIPKSE